MPGSQTKKIEKALNKLGYAMNHISYEAVSEITTMQFVDYLNDRAVEVRFGSFKAITGKER